ncbi:transposable element Tcb1 transposase [Trichonephila clavipes]|nr:transposable element Tcb1 transposase [Trichonephila clavipes]
MQEGTTDRRGRSHPSQCTTSLSARTIQRRLQQSGLSAKRPLLGLPLTQNHRRLRRQWCDERRMWVAEWNEVAFTDESRICLQHHDGRIRVWRHRGERMLNSCVMHHHTGPAPGIMIELLPWPARPPDLSPIENMWSMVAQRLTQITPPAATPDQFWQRVEAALSVVPQEHIQCLFEPMPRRVAAVISNNGGYSGY